MNTNEYIMKYGLNTSKSNKFNREEFIKDLSNEFLERFNNTKVAREKMGLEFDFRIFLELVKDMYVKFNSISNKKYGPPLTQKLFSAFYAITVIPTREKFFPKEHMEITNRRNNL